MKQYRIAKGWRILAVTCCLLFIAFAGALVWLQVHRGSANGFYAVLVFGLLISSGMIYMLYDTVRTRIVIDQEELTMQRAFNSQRRLLREISGYRRGEKGRLLIVSMAPGVRSIEVSDYLERKEELQDWLTAHYPDLDLKVYEDEKSRILANKEFGNTRAEREANLSKARNTSKAVNLATVFVFAWGFLFPQPYELIMTILLMSPWAGLWLTRKHRGLVKLAPGKQTAYPSVILLLFFPAMGVAIRAVLDYHLYQWTLVIKPMAILTLVIGAAAQLILWPVIRQEAGKRILILVFLYIFSALYAYGAIVYTNCFYDESPGQTFPVMVVDKRSGGGKSNSYYIRVSAWGRFKEEEDVRVTFSLYDQVNVADNVTVFLEDGRWSMPWFRIIPAHN